MLSIAIRCSSETLTPGTRRNLTLKRLQVVVSMEVSRVTGESEWAVMVVREYPGGLQKQAEVSPWSVQV